MALRNIRDEGDEVLRKKSKVVEKIDEKIITLLDDMAETMKKEGGVGLAAPQIGVLKRIVVIDVGDGLIELINPQIIETNGEHILTEGCLSVPPVNGEQVVGEVKRPKFVKVRALDRNGNQFETDGEGILAQAFCHEIDHLDGILFIDKVIKYIG